MAKRVIARQQGFATAAGVAIVNFEPPTGYKWEVLSISVQTNGAATSIADVALNGFFICGSATGNSDNADGTPIDVSDGSTLSVTWIGASVGATCIAILQINEDPV